MTWGRCLAIKADSRAFRCGNASKLDSLRQTGQRHVIWFDGELSTASSSNVGGGLSAVCDRHGKQKVCPQGSVVGMCRRRKQTGHSRSSSHIGLVVVSASGVWLFSFDDDGGVLLFSFASGTAVVAVFGDASSEDTAA